VSAVQQEPVLAAASTAGLAGGGVGYAATSTASAAGWVQILATLLPVLLPLLTGWLARRKVTPTANVPPLAP